VGVRLLFGAGFWEVELKSQDPFSFFALNESNYDCVTELLQATNAE